MKTKASLWAAEALAAGATSSLADAQPTIAAQKGAPRFYVHSGSFGPGNHECFVGAVAPQGVTHELDDWAFTVKFWRMES